MFALLAMKGVLLPQILELWDVSKTQFGLLLSIYGLASNFMYVALSWAQDRFAPQKLIAIPMIVGGITTFFLGKTSDFNVLLGLLLVLAICCEGAFWPAILSSVRKSTSDEQQSKVFGFLEGGRGLIEFLQNAITVGLYALLGYSVLGLEVAFMINGGVMVALGIASWFTLPDKPLLKSSDSSGTMMQEVREGMKLTLSMPEIWLTGLVGFFIYFAYTSLPFYVTYLNESFTLPAIAASIFALFSTSAGRIGSAFVASFVTNRVFGDYFWFSTSFLGFWNNFFLLRFSTSSFRNRYFFDLLYFFIFIIFDNFLCFASHVNSYFCSLFKYNLMSIFL